MKINVLAILLLAYATQINGAAAWASDTESDRDSSSEDEKPLVITRQASNESLINRFEHALSQYTKLPCSNNEKELRACLIALDDAAALQEPAGYSKSARTLRSKIFAAHKALSRIPLR